LKNVKKNHGLLRMRRIFSVLFVVIASSASAAVFSAELPIGSTIIYEELSFVDGTETSIQSFSDLDEGLYKLRLTDFEFPEAFGFLGATFSSSTDVVGSLLLGEHNSSASLVFEIDQPDTYYLAVAGIAGSAYNLGMYGVELAAVPLPPAAYLFFSGLMGVVLVGRRARERSQ